MKKVAVVIGLGLVLALPASAFGQATRTWVSGVGDDANPCSRTAPCKTFAGAISKTAMNGEIDALDPGGFGTVTITKSITIDGGGGAGFGSILSSLTNGVRINITDAADTHKRVVLRNLSINGTANGLTGVDVLAAKSVRIEKSRIFGFTLNGIDFTPANTPTKLIVHDTTIADNTQNGILVSPGTTGTSGTANRISIGHSQLIGNSGSAIESTNTPGPNRVAVNVFSSLLADNAFGITSNGAESQIRLANNDIYANAQGLRSLNSGQILSFGNNRISANAVDGVPTGMLGNG